MDSHHIPPAVRDLLVTMIKNEHYSVGVNAPFAGALVPLSSYRIDRRICSIMIEINRRLYLHEQSGVKNHYFASARAILGRLVILAAEAAACRAPTSA